MKLEFYKTLLEMNKALRSLVGFCALILISSVNLISQTTVNLIGNGNFIVPFNVTSITVNAWGAGGSSGSGSGARGGGGGGAGASSVLVVTPGQSIPFSVAVQSAIAANGAITTFGSPVLVQAAGGSASTTTTGGVGGFASSSIGTITVSGVIGDNSAVNVGGAGGNSGTISTIFGVGGVGGVAMNGDGANGGSPGGGGGGKAGPGGGTPTTGRGAAGRITVTFADPPIMESLACRCNNNQTPNMQNGTYATTLIIRNNDNTPLPAGINFSIVSTTGLTNTLGGTLGMPSFFYCNGGCPTGVQNGQYYLPVHVQNSGMYSANVDGPDPDNLADVVLANTTCATLYPALPIIPFADVNCLNPGINNFSSDGSVYNINNVLAPITLPSGFSQTGTGVLMVDNAIYNETNNNPVNEIYLIREQAGCRVSSYDEFKMYNAKVAALNNLLMECRDTFPGDSIFLSEMISSTNSGVGQFYINGNLVPRGKIDYTGPICTMVEYRIVDSCGVTRTDTKQLQVTIKPKAGFNFNTPPNSPVCSLTPVSTSLTRTSTGPNPTYTITSNRVGLVGTVTPTGTGADLNLPAPPMGGDVRYTICLIETNNTPTSSCGAITPSNTACADTICKSFVVYRDRSDCGANALFTSQCETYVPAYCQTFAVPGVRLNCTFFPVFQSPPVLTATVTLDNDVLNCDTETLSGSYNVSFFGLDFGNSSSCTKVQDLPFVNIVCDVLNFEILGWKPLGALYDALRCDKCLIELLVGILGTISGGDGGGVIVMADTDGDGSFDYLITNRFGFPVSDRFTIPNRVKGGGTIGVRAVGAWVNSPADVCGTFDRGNVNLLDRLPIGSIPVVGAIIEDILETFGCQIEAALGVVTDATATVINNAVPVFANCNPSGYVFSQTLECSSPVNWSIPVAYDGCSEAPLAFRGITSNVDTTRYSGIDILSPQLVIINGPGIYQTAGPIPGSTLPPGIYPVTYTAASCNGLPQTCTFNVVVTAGNPILECPSNIIVNTDVDVCYARVTGLAPYQGIGCASIINYSYTTAVSDTLVRTTSTTPGTHNVPDGRIFELGVTTITYTMQVDINGDGDYNDPNETQTCDFTVTVQDRQLPKAVCSDVTLQLNNLGSGTVFATEGLNRIFVDGGSTDNCGNFTVQISRDGVIFGDSLNFACSNIGQNVITLRVRDAAGNESICKSVVTVSNFFEGFKLDLDVPEVCFEPFQDTFDFSNYIVIARPDGLNIPHEDVGTLGPQVVGTFGISAFLPDLGSTNDPGTITADGVYKLGSGTGWITISYILSIDGQINQINPTSPLRGCFIMVHDVFRVEKLYPNWKGGFLCCDERRVLLGHALWDKDQNGIVNGTIKGTLPLGSPAANYITLDEILGSYPRTVYGEWTGQGVVFANPDGVAFSGDEYYYFDPAGLDGSYTLTYTVGDEPCEFIYSQEMVVTCQDLQVALSDITVCPASWVPERVVLIDLNEPNSSITLVVAVTGLGALGLDGAHIGTMDPNEPCDDLVDKNLPTGTQIGACAPDMEVLKVVDGRVVIPGFWSPAVRNKTYPITVRTYQVLNNPTLPEFAFGCEDMFTYNITVVDTVAPLFLNCPKVPIVVDAIVGQCVAFVNFEYPIAYDTCMGFTKVVQVDTTGLKSGSLFPVGLTVLSYTTIDTVGNQNYCELKIVVQDFRLAPRIQCPATTAFTAFTDVDKCGATVNGLKPVLITDNCLPHVAVTYEVTGPSGEQVACGFENASGTFFPIGTSTVKYKVQDQPLVKITEVVNQDGRHGVEITNFGPAALDITCGKFMLKNAAGVVIETFTVPTNNNISTMFQRPIFPPVIPVIWNVRTPNNILDVGETFTHIFDGDQNGDGILDVTNTYNRCDVRKYCFGFLDYVIDEAVVNDQVSGEVLLRSTICDTDRQTDFRVANPCDTMSFGMLNPGLPVMTFSNDTVGLQLLAPNMDMCSFTVTVTDVEAPTCIWHDSIRVANTAPRGLMANLCLRDSINMPAGLVDDINIFNLNITTPNAGAITAYLKSPLGKRIQLFRRVCGTDTTFCAAPVGISGTLNINVNLDENLTKTTAAPPVNTAGCSPLGQGLTFRPMQSFNEFYGTQGGGRWVLEVFGEEGTTGTLNSWDLQILYQIPFGQRDTTIVNSPGLCDTVFSWIHPMLEDNCRRGGIQLQYLFSNPVTGVSDTVTSTLKNLMNTINTSGCLETRRFRVGTTEVRYTLTDQYGNMSVCSFKVIIVDNENPVFVPFTCSDKQIFLLPGQCTGALLNPPMATDNCGLDTIMYCFRAVDGSDSIRADINVLPIGDYILIAKAIDIYGNIERCQFRVVVIEFIPPQRDLACLGEINVTLDITCQATIDPSFILAAGNNVRCYDNYDIIVTDLLGNPHSTTFTKEDEGKRFKVLIIDNQPPRVLPFNSCWGYVNIEKKLGPTFLCPRDTVVACNIDVNAKNLAGKYLLGEPLITSCEKSTTVWYQDQWTQFGQCDSLRAQVVRTWYLENEKGQRTECIQRITILKMQLRDIVFPADVLNIDCRKVAMNSKSILPDSTGFPTLAGHNVNRVGGLCMVSFLYTDERFEICNGSYEILRTWKLRDMCGPVSATNPRTHIQVIKVIDNQGPSIKGCPQDTTISVLAWECLYEGSIPVPSSISDMCSPTFTFSPRILGGGRISGKMNADGTLSANVIGLRKGTYTIIYDFKDECLNKSTCSYRITIVDKIAPVASAKEFITVTLTKSDLAGTNGLATLGPKNIDNGSYDNCGPIYMEVRREDGAPSCSNEGELYDHDNNSATARIRWNNNVTYNSTINGQDSLNPLHTFDSRWDTDKGQYVKFCCEDIGKTVKVWLRVWDDADMNGTFGTAGDNFNETWASVRVEDKTVPVLACPSNITISCDRAEFVKRLGTTWVNLDSTAKAQTGTPGINGTICNNYIIQYRDSEVLRTCNDGVVTREYRLVDSVGVAVLGPTVTCKQTITVTFTTSAVLEWPIDLHGWNKCTLTEAEVLANTVLSIEPPIYGNVRQGKPLSCITGTNVTYTSTVATSTSNPVNATSNGLTPNTAPLDVIHRNRARFNSNYKNIGCSVFGKIIKIEEYTVGVGCRKWLVTFNYINWCDNSNAGCRQTIYKYEDITPPVITVCPSLDVDITDASCRASISVSPVATDAGGCEAGFLWRVELRLKGQTALFAFQNFDNRTLAPTLNLNTITYVRTGTTSTTPGLEAGIYDITYIVTDGCGNVAECRGTIGVWAKAPTPYCISLSSAVMKNGQVELWAKDFDNGSFPNCNNGPLLFTFDRMNPVLAKINVEHFFKGAGLDATLAEYNAGTAQKWNPLTRTSGKLFGCKVGDGSTFPASDVKMTVWDNNLRSDFCNVRLTLLDNQGACGGNSRVSIEGEINAVTGDKMTAVSVSLNANLPEYPVETLSDKEGKFRFGNQPLGADYQVTAKKDGNYLNGVNTLDLLKIQRHILGLAKFESGYQMIAADVDNDKVIRVSDLVELRKLILGMMDKFANNPSWRFVDARQSMGTTPWPFNEVMTHSELKTNVSGDMYMGVKIGDVDGEAQANAQSMNTEIRNVGIKLFTEDRLVKVGEIVSIELLASEFTDVYGFQMSADLKGLILVEAEGRGIDLDANNVATPKSGLMTMSWTNSKAVSVSNESKVMILTFEATQNGQLSKMFSITPFTTTELMRSEAYIGDNFDVKAISLEFRNGKEGSFALLQNEPNPWKGETMIKYELPNAGVAKFTILDMVGRVIASKSLNGIKGENQVMFTKSELAGATGLLIYKVESGDFTAQKKMIVID